jgi:hypothetical protein
MDYFRQAALQGVDPRHAPQPALEGEKRAETGGIVDGGAQPVVGVTEKKEIANGQT